ncbi:hypothetical protein DV736_g1221, partial [Chaetothyriales sp. CBS 134916]
MSLTTRISNGILNTFVRRNYVLLSTVFIGAFAFEIAFDKSTNALWDSWNKGAQEALLDTLFRSLTADRADYFADLFPFGFPASYRVQDVQNVEQQPEYTRAMRGQPCGHILKLGEATYHCATCTDDSTAVLCAPCFAASDHEGHQLTISVSGGNSSCCDCGDAEAWKRPVHCAIHPTLDDFVIVQESESALPADLQAAIRVTISAVLDFFCDVISCAPENLRLPKSADSVRKDEQQSRLQANHYVSSDDDAAETNPEFCLLIWNDEKHTIIEFRDQVSRACRARQRFGELKAQEANDYGRSIVRYSRDLDQLIRMAKIIEEIKITVTIRSSRDTFREQMCGSIIDWLSDIAGCSIANDPYILRRIMCEEMLQLWQKGSSAWNLKIGKEPLDTHGTEEARFHLARDRDWVHNTQNDADATDDADDMDTDVDNDFIDIGDRIEADPLSPAAVPVDTARLTPPGQRMPLAHQPLGPDESANYMNLPKPSTVAPRTTPDGPPPHWLVYPPPALSRPNLPVYEDLTKNIRLDSMVLFDLRLWKLARTSLRDLYISTVVKIPQFKRILGLRFSGLYTTLAQLYLVADREPDHSIVNLSLQILTTPSICQEVIEKGSFLTYLMAILYTYTTTKAVGFPSDVDPGATLAYDAGAVGNRRLFHFFGDLKYMLASKSAQATIRADRRYLSQYLDLVKICQGICPNVRAVGDHVEYETDSWISAALLTREINKLCRQFAETYHSSPESDAPRPIFAAIGLAAEMAMMYCLGLERNRFDQGEIKDLVQFHLTTQRVVNFSVEKGSMSFHHPLHYTLSWLLEGGKDSKLAIEALKTAADSLMQKINNIPLGPKDSAIKTIIQSPDDALLAMFDYPLRVCAWLAQMKANMWVRNGMSLRHQMSQYKSVQYRDLAHQRDLFLLQTALVTCDRSRVLSSMVNRFGLTEWMSGKYSSLADCEDSQMLDLAEDLIYLLVNLLADRDNLTSQQNDPESGLNILRKEIAHSLCFKAMSYSDLTSRLTERVQYHEKLQEVLDTMTTFRPPEALNDTGLLSLKDEFLAELDPYNSHFSKNQRDEAENIYKKWKAKKLNKNPDEIVLEPKLYPITNEAYQDLSAFVHTRDFAETIYRCLVFAAVGHKSCQGITLTRVESFLQIVLQLTLIATLEDNTVETDSMALQSSFIHHASTSEFPCDSSTPSTVLHMLHKIWLMEDLAASRSKIRHILRLFNQKHPRKFLVATVSLNLLSGRFDTASPASMDNDLEAKKKQAMERKAKVMAQFQAQQQSFVDNSGFDWDDQDMESPDQELPSSTENRLWKYPAGLCIQCREETNDTRLYGTFAMITDGHLLRETNVDDVDFVAEVLHAPNDLDRSIEHRRPFGVSGSNITLMTRLNAAGEEEQIERQGLSKGWPKGYTMKGPMTTSCGHIMHFACFENYYQSVQRRHAQQVARNHPERLATKEFVCPLCKALANTFLPIIWKSTIQSYPGSLAVNRSFQDFMHLDVPTLERSLPYTSDLKAFRAKALEVYTKGIELIPTESLIPDARQPQPHQDHRVTELANVYLRLREALGRFQDDSVAVKLTDAHSPRPLLDTLANSIIATEIAYRGRDAEFGATLISCIPQQTLSHLQILSSTVRAYSAPSLSRPGAHADEAFYLTFSKMYQSLFPSTGLGQENVLTQDAFHLIVDASMILCPITGIELHHMLRLALEVCVIRTVLAYAHSNLPPSTRARPEDVHAMKTFLRFLLPQIAGTTNTEPAPSDETLATLHKLVSAHALTFLRQTVILFHVAHGVDYPTTAGSEASLVELERLLHYLQLPSMNDLLDQYDEFHQDKAMRDLAESWLQGLRRKNPMNVSRMLHPAPLELIGLPMYYDVLLELSSKQKCPTTGKEVSDPALCLFCGEIFCSQSERVSKPGHEKGTVDGTNSDPGNTMLFPSNIHLLIISTLPLYTFARPTPQPQSNDGNGDGGGIGYDPSASGGSDSGSSGPDTGWSLSTGATIAIGVVVGSVVIAGIVMTTLFYLSKKRQWRLRERARGSLRRVGKVIMTPRTPMKMTFSPALDRSRRNKRSPSASSPDGQEIKTSLAQSEARMPSSSPPPGTGPASLDPNQREGHSRTRSISRSRGLSINTNIASARNSGVGTQAGRTAQKFSVSNAKAMEMEKNPRRKKASHALDAVDRTQSESKFEMDSPKTPFLSRFVFGRR